MVQLQKKHKLPTAKKAVS